MLFHTVGAHYIPPALFRPTHEGMVSIADMSPTINEHARGGLLAAIEGRMPIERVVRGHFLDGTETEHMLEFEFSSDYWLNVDTGNWALAFDAPATQVLMAWRNGNRPKKK